MLKPLLQGLWWICWEGVTITLQYGVSHQWFEEGDCYQVTFSLHTLITFLHDPLHLHFEYHAFVNNIIEQFLKLLSKMLKCSGHHR